MGMAYGYARVSTREPHEDRQLIALRQWGVEEKNIYLDKLSGKDFNRPQYRRLVRKLKPGDKGFVKDKLILISGKALPQHFMRQGFGIGYSNGLKLIPFSWA